MKKGTVYWITGLAASGKTTLGALLFKTLKKQHPDTVFLDGDLLRHVYGEMQDYSEAGRKEIAMRNSRLCKLLSDQGLNVVCSTISMFWQCQQWNRENIENYREIYLKVPLSVLKERNKGNLYSQKESPVAGVDCRIEEPQHPDLVIANDGSLPPQEILCQIVSELKIEPSKMESPKDA